MGAMAVTAEKAFDLIRGAHERERLAHAFLISGPVGSGKERLAARIVQLVNPPEDDGGKNLFDEPEAPAEEKELDGLQGPQVTLVRPRSKSRQILIDEVRELEREMHLTAPAGRWKVGVIIDADRMRDGPANAFLKTLEEPPPRCLLLLLSAHPEYLLPTIRSRCVDLVLQPTGRVDILGEGEMRMLAKMLGKTAKERSERNALLVKAAFESLLRERKEEITERNKAALKAEEAIYKRATEGNWMEEREKYYAALGEAEYLSMRTALLDLLLSWMGDAVRQKAGSESLTYPEVKVETGQLAESRDLDQLLGGLDALEDLRAMFNTNTQEALAMEVGFLRAFA
jgi:DNA polymerase-3 subunit delta'